jgi:hypothetical protein
VTSLYVTAIKVRAGRVTMSPQHPYTTGVAGVHRLYLTFTGSTSADFVNVNWTQFFR